MRLSVSRWIYLLIPFLLVARYWFLDIPPPGYAIGLLGLIGVVIVVRSEHHWSTAEKVCWVMLAFCLFIIEIRAINEDRRQFQADHTAERDRANADFDRIAKGIDKSLKESSKHFDATMQSQTQISNQQTGGDAFCYFIPIATPVRRAQLVIGNSGHYTLPLCRFYIMKGKEFVSADAKTFIPPREQGPKAIPQELDFSHETEYTIEIETLTHQFREKISIKGGYLPFYCELVAIPSKKILKNDCEEIPRR